MKYFLNHKEISVKELEDELNRISETNRNSADDWREYSSNLYPESGNGWNCETIELVSVDSDTMRFIKTSNECFW